MKDAAPQPIYLADYTPPPWLVDTIELTFRLGASGTRVLSRIEFRPNPKAVNHDFFLHGEDLTLINARIDGKAIAPIVTPEGLTAVVPDAAFLWEAEVEIHPEANTALEGLYVSNGMYCTQCEAEGFRKITYYPDRPDVMAIFTVRIESDLPVLLSNGNPVEQGKGFAVWHDPWPKPAYLFALVAGDLRAHSDAFTTGSGRQVALNIWTRPGPDEKKCAFGMEALKRSMKWDEDTYGREYDLDLFNIVAVDDFNMGAMENKGLNIFNSAAVLASPETATDANFERIEGIIAHEYFHNWTGNRITCRDWFQLCLKEGLTVFRDQQFTSDMRSAAVKRIDDVLMLRARQFREDAGPLAHPVRPESFVEINNFYTATVYEKGAEIIGMLKRLVGAADYAKALDLYFERHDGEAAAIEDWLGVFEDTTGRDLTQFKRWYSQAGTPRVTVTDDFKDGTYTLHFKQETPPTPGQDAKQPLVIPVALGLLGQNGAEVMPTTTVELTETEQSVRFETSVRPIPSLLRGFSAPVILSRETSTEERAFLLAHDTDPFNKWEAGRALAKECLMAMVKDGAAPANAYLDALEAAIADESLDPAFRALVLTLPGEDDLAQTLSEGGTTPDPSVIHSCREVLAEAIGIRSTKTLAALYDRHQVAGPYSPDAKPAGKRALTNAALHFLTRQDGGTRAEAQFAEAGNMTQEIAALSALLKNDAGKTQIESFEARWRDDRLVMDKWFALQVASAAPEKAVAITEGLTQHPAFDWKNPNRFRATIGALSGNPAGFHDPSGAGYRLVADWLIRLDPVNPQTAARMSAAFETWRRYDVGRQSLIQEALERILDQPSLSRDMAEMASRMLGAQDAPDT